MKQELKPPRFSKVTLWWGVIRFTRFTKPDVQQLSSKNRNIIENSGAKIMTSAHAFGSLGRAVNKKFGGIQIDLIVTGVLRLFCQVVKVRCEIACMAADAGLIRTDEEVIVIGGSLEWSRRCCCFEAK